ncbi:hypothetical protein C7212DRAFT_305101 [Tuber magnatum]|uniref:Uncharacterized protein n=1 Tax=Tuber magnatum TaxID=42249 RepID=A0A317SZ69_9PEZI|nr:hypothetical protein C7212DRAFT_305101 [Tuber magnatum]
MAYNTRSSAHTTRSKTKTPHKATATATTLKTTRKVTPKSTPTAKKTPSRRTGAGVAKKPRHHKRKLRLSDKLEGALLKVEGTLTGRRGVKAAGTKKIGGTDGKGEKRSIRRSI